MIVHRAVMLPRVAFSDDPTKVCFRLPIDIQENGSTYYETRMTPEEADRFISEMYADRIRAQDVCAARGRLGLP